MNARRKLLAAAALVLGGCATTSGSGAAAYHLVKPAAPDLFSGECGLDIAPFQPDAIMPAKGEPVPAWAQAVDAAWTTGRGPMYRGDYFDADMLSTTKAPDTAAFYYQNVYRMKQTFNHALGNHLTELRAHEDAHAGVAAAGKGGHKEFRLITSVVSVQPPVGEVPMKLNLLLELRNPRPEGAHQETEPVLESVTIGLDVPGGSFADAGRQLAETFAVYMKERLTCFY